MNQPYVSRVGPSRFPLWGKRKSKRSIQSFEIELTARCNNNCRHCYINLPAADQRAKEEELSFAEIKEIVNEAVGLGAFGCLVTGGEPLLREDFTDIYLFLKKRGLLVSLFTNATLITREHIELFKRYPPKDVEVTVYGVTEDTYEGVTRRQGSFTFFRRGLEQLFKCGVQIHLKSMALKSNVHEFEKIARFCRERTQGYFRFDPILLLRFDGNPARNQEIKDERLSAADIVAIDRSDPYRWQTLAKDWSRMILPNGPQLPGNQLFYCGLGKTDCALGYNGFFRVCASLYHPDCMFNLREGSLTEAWQNFVPHVVGRRSDRKEFLERCAVCPLINLCPWCPAHSHLESGEMDMPVEYFCELTHARAERFLGKERALPNLGNNKRIIGPR